MLGSSVCKRVPKPIIFLVARQQLHASSGLSQSASGRSGSDVVNTNVLDSARAARGTGGRSSFSGRVATVFGATGMMGRILCNRLGKEGTQLIIPYRGDQWDARGLKLVGDLGQVWFLETDIRDPESIRKAIQHSNIVINCIGTNYETRNFKYNDVHVEGPRLIARVARECGVEKLIHFSALNASPNPQKIFQQSKFLASKYEGEQAVKEEFEDAVIVRPSTIYGESDRFLFYYANDFRRGLRFIPLWRKGEMTIKMPVHQSDVADGIMKIVKDKDIKGITYDFVGPDKYLLSDIIDYVFQLIQRPIVRTHLTPTRIGFTYLYELINKRPLFNLDYLEREFISDSLSSDSRNPALKDLGIQFRRFDETSAWHLKVFNRFSYYNEKLGEFPEPVPPKPLSEDYEFQLRRKIREKGDAVFYIY